MKDIEDKIIVDNILEIAKEISKNHYVLIEFWITLYQRKVLSEDDVNHIQSLSRPNNTDLDLAIIVLIRVKNSKLRNAFVIFLNVLRDQGFVELSCKLHRLCINAHTIDQSEQASHLLKCDNISRPRVKSQESISTNCPTIENNSNNSRGSTDSSPSLPTTDTEAEISHREKESSQNKTLVVMRRGKVVSFSEISRRETQPSNDDHATVHIEPTNNQRTQLNTKASNQTDTQRKSDQKRPFYSGDIRCSLWADDDEKTKKQSNRCSIS